jgi:FMN-dependent NADH-azoreductase
MSPALLHLDGSCRPDALSRALGRRFAERWLASHPGGELRYRDVGSDPPPHVSPEQADHYMYRPGCQPEHPDVRRSEAYIEELAGADLLLLATPMHNFSVPSAVKAWIDHVTWPGRTFDPVAGKGLLDLPAVVILTRGGGYGPGSPREAWNFQEPYLAKVFELMGIVDVQFVAAELTLFTGPDSPDRQLGALGEQSLEAALRRIDALAESSSERAVRPAA